MPHNAEDVISDIEDVKDDLRSEMKTTTRGQMQAIHDTAVGFVQKDADFSGDLRRSLSVTVMDMGDTIVGKVETDAGIAPYAPFVEFGTGSHSLQTASQADSERPRAPMDGAPIDFPYSSPTIVTDAQFEGLVSAIQEWVKEKPVFPDDEGMTQEDLGFAIAASIVENGTYAHPFLQPAWFYHELNMRRAYMSAVRDAFS